MENAKPKGFSFSQLKEKKHFILVLVVRMNQSL